MQRLKPKPGELLLLFAVALLLAGGAVLAQSNGYNLSWWSVDGGGATFSNGGDYRLGAAIGQAEAGGALKGGRYALAGGFWSPGEVAAPPPPPGDRNLFLPLLQR